MQELIDAILKELEKRKEGTSYVYVNDVEEVLTAYLPPATILSSQFKDGEPEGKGRYICKIKINPDNGTDWTVVTCNGGLLFLSKEYESYGLDNITIIKHAKLPE